MLMPRLKIGISSFEQALTGDVMVRRICEITTIIMNKSVSGVVGSNICPSLDCKYVAFIVDISRGISGFTCKAR